MKSKASIILSFVAFVLVTLCISCIDNDSGKRTQKEFLSEGRLKNEAGALEIATNLNKTFKSSLKSTDSQLAYPDYFGGATITDEGRLLILVKGDTVKAKEDLISRSKSNDFIIKSCEYSFKELSDLNRQLGDVFEDEQTREELTWVAVGISPSSNRVFVRLEDFSAQKIAAFKAKVSDSDIIVFEQGEKAICDDPMPIENNDSTISENNMPTTRGIYGINPGSKITVLGYTGSVGYRARYQGNEGFVTAAHCIPNVGGIAYYNGSYAGDAKVYSLGTTVDAAFVQTRPDYDVTDRTQYGSRYLTPTIIPIYNLDAAAVTMEGCLSGTSNYGVVRGIDVSISFSKTMPYIGYRSYTVRNLMEATFPGQGGDSGGIVYGSTNMQIAGCYTGHTSSYRYFSYAGYINDLFGLTLY